MKKIVNKSKALIFIVVGMIGLNASAWADESKDNKLPLWEIGIAGGLLHIPHYVGSDQNYTLPLAIPFVIYRGDILKADRQGIRGELFANDNLSLDLAFSFGLPVKSSNRAREGMPDLHLTGQIGPRLNWNIGESEAGTRYSFHLPVRYVRDIKNNELGWVAEPTLALKRNNLGRDGKFSVHLAAGLLYASRKYNEYYYQVDEEFALEDRPAYQASSGISNYFLGVSGTYHLSPRVRLNSFIRYKSLVSGGVDDSPLAIDDDYFAFGIGISWILKTSEQ